MAWTGLVRVDGRTYTWLGAPDVDGEIAEQTAFEYTASKSVFTIGAGGKVEVRASFVSPLAPENYSVQSVVASYLDVEVRSLDGEEHDVQLYTDISAGRFPSHPCTSSCAGGWNGSRHAPPAGRDLVRAWYRV